MKINKGIADHKKGDTWDGIEIIANTQEAMGIIEPINLTGATILAEFKLANGQLAFKFDTSDGSIIVAEPLLGKIVFASKKIDYKENTYFFDVQVTYPNGVVETIVPTHSWTIYN
jgi:hypothetical protein